MEPDGLAPSDKMRVVPVIRDSIVMYSTLQGCVSYRSPDNGSIYINKLCQKLKSYAIKEDLLTILGRVNKEMETFDCADKDDGECSTQVPEYWSTLTHKKVYFDVLPGK